MPSSRGDEFRISGIEPAHVCAVLRALARRSISPGISPGTADAVRYYLKGSLTELPSDAVSDIAREADRFLPGERARATIRPTDGDPYMDEEAAAAAARSGTGLGYDETH